MSEIDIRYRNTLMEDDNALEFYFWSGKDEKARISRGMSTLSLTKSQAQWVIEQIELSESLFEKHRQVGS